MPHKSDFQLNLKPLATDKESVECRVLEKRLEIFFRESDSGNWENSKRTIRTERIKNVFLVRFRDGQLRD